MSFGASARAAIWRRGRDGRCAGADARVPPGRHGFRPTGPLAERALRFGPRICRQPSRAERRRPASRPATSKSSRRRRSTSDWEPAPNWAWPLPPVWRPWQANGRHDRSQRARCRALGATGRARRAFGDRHAWFRPRRTVGRRGQARRPAAVSPLISRIGIARRVAIRFADRSRAGEGLSGAERTPGVCRSAADCRPT